MLERSRAWELTSLATLGHPNLTAYCASKFAVRGITQSVAAELGEAGIRVNTICPGRK